MIINDRILVLYDLDGMTLKKLNGLLEKAHPEYSNITFEVEYDYDGNTIYLRGDREETELEIKQREEKQFIIKKSKEEKEALKLKRDFEKYQKLKKQFDDLS